MFGKPPRLPWNGFPDVSIHASESAVKQHPRYPAAKSGDAEAAIVLVHDTLNPDQVGAPEAMSGWEGHWPISGAIFIRMAATS